MPKKTELMEEYEERTGKNAVWAGKVTKQFKEWSKSFKELQRKKKKLKKKEEKVEEKEKKIEEEKEELKKKKEEEIKKKFNGKIDELLKKKEDLEKKKKEKLDDKEEKIEKKFKEKEKKVEKELERLRKDVLRTKRKVYSEKQRFKQTIILVSLLYIFILGINLIKEGALNLSMDFFSQITRTLSSFDNSFIIGWVASFLTQSGSGIAFLAITLAGAGFLGVESLFYFLSGTIIGNTSTPILVSLFVKSENAHELRHGFEIGIVNLIYSIILVIIIVFIELFTNFYTNSAKYFSTMFGGFEQIKLLPGIITIMTMPIINFYEIILQTIFQDSIINIVFIITGFILLVLSLKHVSGIIIQFLGGKRHTRSIINNYLGSNKKAFLIGLILTILTASNSLTISLIVPLAVVGLIDLKKSIPYIIGTGTGTFIDVLIGSLATGIPLSMSSGLMFTLICFTGVFFVLDDIIVRIIYKTTRFLTRKILRMNKKSILILLIILLIIPLMILII